MAANDLRIRNAARAAVWRLYRGLPEAMVINIVERLIDGLSHEDRNDPRRAAVAADAWGLELTIAAMVEADPRLIGHGRVSVGA